MQSCTRRVAPRRNTLQQCSMLAHSSQSYTVVYDALRHGATRCNSAARCNAVRCCMFARRCGSASGHGALPHRHRTHDMLLKPRAAACSAALRCCEPCCIALQPGAPRCNTRQHGFRSARARTSEQTHDRTCAVPVHTHKAAPLPPRRVRSEHAGGDAPRRCSRRRTAAAQGAAASQAQPEPTGGGCSTEPAVGDSERFAHTLR